MFRGDGADVATAASVAFDTARCRLWMSGTTFVSVSASSRHDLLTRLAVVVAIGIDNLRLEASVRGGNADVSICDDCTPIKTNLENA